MSMRISTNIASLNAQRNLRITGARTQAAYQKLSSGYRINQASDDAAGLAISEQFKAKLRGLSQAKRNAMDGVSMIQTAEGALNEVSSMLIRLRELGIQSASDTIGDMERKFIDVEYQQLKSELQRISEITTFNSTNLLNGTGGIIDLQIGVNNDAFKDRISFDASVANATIESLGVAQESVASKEQAQSSISSIDDALVSVNAIRANFGAIQNRLTSTINNLEVFHENVSAANSRIRDADVAATSSELAKSNILQQAGISVLSQANNAQLAALKLLG